MNQPSFDFSPARARNTDPVTSHEAAGRMNAKKRVAKQRAAVFNMIENRPGLTTAELASAYAQDRQMIARRCPELRDIGLVRNGEPRVCEVAGTRGITWYPTTKAAQSD